MAHHGGTSEDILEELISEFFNETSNETAHHSSHSEHSHTTISDQGLAFFLICLFLGAVFRFLIAKCFKHRKPPYTVVLFIVGGLIAALSHATGFFSDLMAEAAAVHPHVIIFLLLPPLLYESALDVDFHVFWKVFYQSVLLAGPGVFIFTGLFAICAHFIFTAYAWSWSMCLLLGSILAATDPVAVVAALHELGAPKKLSIIIDGEALLNDGSAFVLFLIFKDMAAGVETTFGGNVVFFLRLACGGPVWGYLVAMFVEFWLLSDVSDALVEVSITLVATYAVFYLSEVWLGVSGVLAVVTFGLYMSARGKYAISTDVEHSMHSFLSELSYICNTVIFLLAGVVVYEKMAYEDHDVFVDPTNWAYLFINYFLIHVLRALAVFVCFPFLREMGYGVSTKECWMMVYGGLRGAVGLALALLVSLESGIPKLDQDLIAFHVAGIVFLTLVINGTTTDLVYKWLAMYPANPYRGKIFEKAIDEAAKHIEEREKEMKHHLFYRAANWDTVRLLAPLLNKTNCSIRPGGHLHLVPEHLESLIDCLKHMDFSREIELHHEEDFEQGKLMCLWATNGSVDQMRQALQLGGDPNACDYDRRTALHLAAAEGNVEIVSLLIDKKADVNFADRHSQPPLYEAITSKSQNKEEVMRLLLAAGAVIHEKLVDGQDICKAAASNDVDQLRQFKLLNADMNFHDYDLRTALHLAAGEANLEAVQFLVENKANVNVKDRWGGTPLRDAVMSNASEGARITAVVQYLKNHGASSADFADGLAICQAASENNVARLQQCLNLGVEVNTCDYDKRTPMHLAASEAALDACRFLMDSKANPNPLDRWKRSPLDDAVDHAEVTGDHQVVDYLRSVGAHLSAHLNDEVGKHMEERAVEPVALPSSTEAPKTPEINSSSSVEMTDINEQLRRAVVKRQEEKKNEGSKKFTMIELKEITETYYNALRANYRHDFEERRLADEAIVPLIEAADKGAEAWLNNADNHDQFAFPLQEEWSFLTTNDNGMQYPLPENLRNWASHPDDSAEKHGYFARIYGMWQAFKKIGVSVEIGAGYIRAHSRAKRHLQSMLVDDSESRTEAAAQIVGFVDERILAANAFLENIKASHPVIYEIVTSVFTARASLQIQREVIVHQTERGLISHSEEEEILHRIDERVLELQTYRWGLSIPRMILDIQATQTSHKKRLADRKAALEKVSTE